MIGEVVTGLGVEDLLDTVEVWHAEQTERELGIFLAAARFADLNRPDDTSAAGRALPGMEQPKRLGGAGTPLVWEFACAELGPRIGRSSWAARSLMADALDCRHRLPRLWARVCKGEVPVLYARHVAQQTRELSADAAATVDAAVAEYADGRLGWSRFETLVAAKIVEADPDLAAARERAAAQDEFAKVGRSNEHGQKTLYVRTATAAMIRIDASIAYLADALAALGDTDTVDQRRAKALLILANPTQALQLLAAFAAHRTTHDAGDHSGDGDRESGQLDLAEPEDDCPDADVPAAHDDATADATAGVGDPAAAFTRPFRPHQIRPDSRFTCGFDPTTLLPPVTLYLHLYARTDTGHIGPVTRWEGEGPITTAYVRDLLGPHARFTIRPVLDLPGIAPVDGYEIPDRHREAVHLRSPADVFPFAPNTGRNQQVDHTVPYVPPDHGGPPGQTGLHNLAPVTTFHHRVKTHGGWQVKQPLPGILIWRDPHGRIYLVDHTGTRPLGKTDPHVELPDLTLEVYPDDPNIEMYYEGEHLAS